MEITRTIPGADIEIYGEGSIGDKAGQLAQKTPALRAIGFHTPRRVVLAEGFFSGFFQENSLGQNLRTASGDPAVMERILNGVFPQDELATLLEITRSEARTPWMIRSSAEGDARGTGIYKSEVAKNNPSEVGIVVRRVLASYFTKSAVAFREDAGLHEGFGVMIEPMVGQSFDFEYDPEKKSYRFAPLLSGYGYTSTLRGAGFINIVPGLGGGVSSKEGERINREELSRSDGDLGEYLFSRSVARDMGRGGIKGSALLDPNYPGKMYVDTNYGDNIVAASFNNFQPRLRRVLYDTNITYLFDMSDRMQQVFNGPQYFEWAMTDEGGSTKFWILQIADVKKQVDSIEFGEDGEVMFVANSVTGSGIKNCTKIVNCERLNQVESLRRFNSQNINYVLIYRSLMTTADSSLRFGDRPLEYADYSNASVFIEVNTEAHSNGGPDSHLDGQLDLTGKFVGMLDRQSDPRPNWKKFREELVEEDRLEVYQGEVRVVASEKQDKMIIYVQGNEQATNVDQLT